MDDVKYHLEPVPVLNKRTHKPLFDRFKRPVFKHVPVVDSIKDRHKYRVTYFEKFTLEMLVGIRIKFRLGEEKDKNDDDFFSEYQLQAMNPAGKVFKMHRIFTAPPVLDNERLFESYEDFRNFYEPTGSIPVYMFLDPGGKTSHGIAVVVAAVVQGERWGALKWVVLDAVVLRVGLVDVAVKCVELVKKWRVDQFGVEGGFDQPEAYASTIDREMRRYCERNNMLQYYRTPCSPANDKNKLQRINTQISSILGHEEQPPSFYLNPKSEAFERMYNQEFRGFGFDIKAAEEHEFDLLDCLASIRIHMVGAEQESDVLGEGFGYQEMI
jgi:hypothetical protein